MSIRYTGILFLLSLLLVSCENQKSSSSLLDDVNLDESFTQMMDSSIDLQSDMEVIIDQSIPIVIDMSTEEMIDAGYPRMPSCIISCAEFVECAIKQCPGYDEADDSLLMEECLSLCTPAIAELFDRVNSCPEKLRFASTVRTDFLNFCDSESEGFCETYIATCGEWLGVTECESHYNEAPLTGEQRTSGAHQQCYEYHLGRAMRALEDGDEVGVVENCERSAGLSICID